MNADCCDHEDSDNESAFCTVYNMLSVPEKAEVRLYLGENCEGDANDAVNKMEKRKPNFIRFGRSGEAMETSFRLCLDSFHLTITVAHLCIFISSS